MGYHVYARTVACACQFLSAGPAVAAIQAGAQRLSGDMKLSVNILSTAGTSANSQAPLFYLRLFVAFKLFGSSVSLVLTLEERVLYFFRKTRAFIALKSSVCEHLLP